MGFPTKENIIFTSPTRRSFMWIASPEEEKILNAKRCQQEGVLAGLKAASVACVASAVPTALIISAASIAAYFITADKTILECARRTSLENYNKRVS